MNTRCKACGAKVLYVRSEKPPHRWMILDAEPDPTGNLVIQGPPDAR